MVFHVLLYAVPQVSKVEFRSVLQDLIVSLDVLIHLDLNLVLVHLISEHSVRKQLLILVNFELLKVFLFLLFFQFEHCILQTFTNCFAFASGRDLATKLDIIC